MDKLLAKLSEQQSVMRDQESALKNPDSDYLFSRVVDQSSTNSLPLTPATDVFPNNGLATRPASATPNDTRASAEEVLRLKLELAQAHNKITRLDQELTQSRLVQTESGRVTPVVSPDLDYPGISGLEQASSRVPGMAAPKAHVPRENAWPTQDDCRSDTGDALSANTFARSRGIWGNGKPGFQTSFLTGSMVTAAESVPTVSWPSARGYSSGYTDIGAAAYGASSSNVIDSGYRTDRLQPDQDPMTRPSSSRRANRYDNRFGSPHSFGGGYSGFGTNQSQYESVVGYSAGPTGPMSSTIGANAYPQYQPQPIGTALSPHATEFTSATGAAWKNEVHNPSLAVAEPRRCDADRKV